MNRDEKVVAVAEIAEQIRESEAVFAVDYRGITVTQAAELRSKLRDADASFRVVKNTLTERAADAAEAEALKELLTGPTALTFVRGDVAAAAKALADGQKATEKLAFKGGLMNGEPVDAAQITAISKLPSRDVLNAQLVGIVASPLTGLARSLNQLIGGLAVALGGVLEKKESGEIPSGDAPAAAAPAAAEEAPADEAADSQPAEGGDTDSSAPADTEQDQDAEAPEPAASTEDPAEGPADNETPQED